MENRPKISVLVPSLNTAAFICQCLDSVITQTLADIEIICIDAGSTDGTTEILQGYQKKDFRIQLLHSSRKSYGYQMNLGLDAAAGDYIGIIESDDWAEADMFEKLWQTAEENSADVVWANFYSWYPRNKNENILFENFAGCEYDKLITAYHNNNRLFSVSPAIWSGIYKKDFLKKNKIRFNETSGASYQDVSFHFMVCADAQRIILLKKPFLHYRRDNEESSVNSTGKVYCICDEMHLCEDFIHSEGLDINIMLPILVQIKLNNYFWNFCRISHRFQWKFLLQMRKELLEHDKDGLIHRKDYTDNNWRILQQILHQPLRFYLAFCKGNRLFTWVRERYFSMKN